MPDPNEYLRRLCASADLLPHGPALKACGNGVVTAQAVEAILRLMSIDITESPDREVITIKKETP